MNTSKLTRYTITILLAACAALPLLLSACQPVNVATSLPTVQPTAVTLPTQPPAATQPPAKATQPPAGTSGDITLDLSGVAQKQTVETIAAVPASAGGPATEVGPQHRRVTLEGYPVSTQALKPQIFIYPVADLAAANENAGKIAADLQALLQTRQTVDKMPFLPQYNMAQVMHAQVKYLDFKSGKGVRFLTQFSQGIYPINNVRLMYTFQGLTSDGKYYIAAVLPVTHPELPATEQVSEKVGAEYRDYLAKTVTWLEQQPGGSFTPDLAKLDALLQSIEVK